MIENLIAIDILEKIEADLRYGNTDRAIENIDKILNNKIYYLMVEYKKIQEKYGKDSEKAKKIEKKINKEMNNVLYGKN
jgi:hypothetical protein